MTGGRKRAAGSPAETPRPKSARTTRQSTASAGTENTHERSRSGTVTASTPKTKAKEFLTPEKQTRADVGAASSAVPKAKVKAVVTPERPTTRNSCAGSAKATPDRPLTRGSGPKASAAEAVDVSDAKPVPGRKKATEKDGTPPGKATKHNHPLPVSPANSGDAVLSSPHTASAAIPLSALSAAVRGNVSPKHASAPADSTSVPAPSVSPAAQAPSAFASADVLAAGAASYPDSTAPISHASGMTVKDFVDLIGQLRLALRELVPRAPPLVSLPEASTAETFHWANLLSQVYLFPHIQLDRNVVVIGRAAKCNVQLADPALAPAVARLIWGGSKALVEALGSTTVHLNSHPLTKGTRTVLRSGDEVSFLGGTTRYSYVLHIFKTREGAASAKESGAGEARVKSKAPPVTVTVTADGEGCGREFEEAEKTMQAKKTMQALADQARQSMSMDALIAVDEADEKAKEGKGKELEASPVNVDFGSSIMDLVAKDGADEKAVNSKGDTGLSSGASGSASKGAASSFTAAAAEKAVSFGPVTVVGVADGSDFVDRGCAGKDVAAASIVAGSSLAVGLDEKDLMDMSKKSVSDIVASGGADSVKLFLKTPGAASAPKGGKAEDGEMHKKRASARTTEVRAAAVKFCEECIVAPGDNDFSFDPFKYSYLPDDLREFLVAWAYVHLRHPDVTAKLKLQSISAPKLLLSGVNGTELYLERIVRALASHFGAELLVFDVEKASSLSWELREPALNDGRNHAAMDAALDAKYKIVGGKTKKTAGKKTAATIDSVTPALPENAADDETRTADCSPAGLSPLGSDDAMFVDEEGNGAPPSDAVAAIAAAAAAAASATATSEAEEHVAGAGGGGEESGTAIAVAGKEGSEVVESVAVMESGPGVVVDFEADASDDVRLDGGNVLFRPRGDRKTSSSLGSPVFKSGDRVVFTGGLPRSFDGRSRISGMPSSVYDDLVSRGILNTGPFGSPSPGMESMPKDSANRLRKASLEAKLAVRRSQSGRGRGRGAGSPSFRHLARRADPRPDPRDDSRDARDRPPRRVRSSDGIAKHSHRPTDPRGPTAGAYGSIGAFGSYGGKISKSGSHKQSSSSAQKAMARRINQYLDGDDDISGPKRGDVGEVVLTFEEDAKRVGVRFDSKVIGGNNLGNLCEHTHGFFCKPEELMHDDGRSGKLSAKGGADNLVPVFVEAVFSELKELRKSKTTPMLIYIRDADRVLNSRDAMMTDPNFFFELEDGFKSLDDRTVLLGTAVPQDIRAFSASLGATPGGLAGIGGSPLGDGLALDSSTASLLFGNGGPSDKAGGGPLSTVQHFLVRHAPPSDGEPGSEMSRLTGGSGSKAFRGGLSGSFDPSFFDHLYDRMEDRLERALEGGPKGGRSSSAFFPQRLSVETPPLDSLLHIDWKKEMEVDAKELKFGVNRTSFQTCMKRMRLSCDELDQIKLLSEKLVSEKEIDVVLGLAVSAQVMKNDVAGKPVLIGSDAEKACEKVADVSDGTAAVSAEAPTDKGTDDIMFAPAVKGDADVDGKATDLANGVVKDAEKDSVRDSSKGSAKDGDLKSPLLTLSAAAISKGIVLSKALGLKNPDGSKSSADSKPWTSQALKDVVTDNEFEKKLLGEGVVVPAAEVGVKFSDIGALDAVKETLQEVVMLPLRRPGLFRKGNLAVPVKGVLLFGLPGTGKTLSAKAVATEAGANFINITMSSIASKWFGEGEKYVRAVFTLARKLAPAVIFVDEVDSMLGRRERPGE